MRVKYMCVELAKIDYTVQITATNKRKVNLTHQKEYQLSQAYKIWPTETETTNEGSSKLNSIVLVS